MKKLFPDNWQDRLKILGFTAFTPIQKTAFEPILSGKNLLGISPTGTGKTLAYLWPSLLNVTPKKAQQLLILAPNTELAGQIFDVCKSWAEPIGLTSQLFLSGSSQKRQIERLKKGPEIIIGTPGRVFELIKLKKIKMMNVNTIVLDEFDELFGDSHYHFVDKILHYVPRNHQLIYMSATDKFDEEKLDNDVVKLNLIEQKLDNIQHYCMKIDKRNRVELLRKMASIPDFHALVFFNNLSDLGVTDEKLTYHQTNVLSLASDVNVKFRKVIIEKFKRHEINLLLTTDLLGRGLDIEHLECVVNFEVPRNVEIYTHRAGRCGRMGKDGFVITFISNPNDLKQLKKYAKISEIILKNQEFYKIQR